MEMGDGEIREGKGDASRASVGEKHETWCEWNDDMIDDLVRLIRVLPTNALMRYS